MNTNWRFRRGWFRTLVLQRRVCWPSHDGWSDRCEWRDAEPNDLIAFTKEFS